MTKNERMQENFIRTLLVFAILMLVAQFTKLPILFAVSMPLVIVPWMCLGAIRKGGIGKGFKFSLTGAYIIWTLGFVSMVLIDHSVFTGTVLGFTKGSAIMIYIVWIIPYFLVSVYYGKIFDKEYITDEDVNEFESKYGEGVEYSEVSKKDLAYTNLDK